MRDETEEWVVAVARCNGRIHWYRSEVDLWVLDAEKWRSEFIAAGYDVPEFNDNFRFGIRTVDAETAPKFLEGMKRFELPKDQLSYELSRRYSTAESWWDVKDLFPVIFVDFDNQSVGAFYANGLRLEKYVPDGWTGELVDFAITYPESMFPASEKFWIKQGSDLLQLLNERGKQLQKHAQAHFKK